MKDLSKRLITAIITGPIFFGLMIFSPAYIFSLVLFLILLVILTTEWPKLIQDRQLALLIAPLYPILPILILIYLNHTNYRFLLILTFISVFAFDTFSYITGNLFGKYKIIPRISPGKSWEGFLGGMFFTYLIINIFFYYLFKYYGVEKIIYLSTIKLLSISILICIFSLCGDLFESYLKRNVNLKDSGNLLPGHGGLLDRFDGVLFVSYLMLVLKYFL